MSARSPRRSFATPFVVTLAAALPSAACYVQSQPATPASGGGAHVTHSTHGTHGTHDHRDGHDGHSAGQPTHTNPPRPTGSQVPPVTNGANAGSPNHGGVQAQNPVVTVSNPPRPTVQPAPPPRTTRAPVHSTDNAGVHQPPAPPTTTRPPVHSTDNAGMQDVKPTVAKTEVRWTVSKHKGTCTAHATPNCPTAPKGQPQPTCNPPPPRPYTCPPALADGANLKIVKRAGASECFVEPGPMSCPKGAICNPPPPQKIACPQ